MAFTDFGINDALTNKMWSKLLLKAMRQNCEVDRLTGKGLNNVIQLKDELQKGPGDRVTFGMKAIPQGDGFTENETAEGNAEALSMYSDSLVINELGHNLGAKSENSIDGQRVPYAMKEELKDSLGVWFAKRKSVSFFNQVCGFTPITDVKYSGLNATVAPGTASGHLRHIFSGSQTTDQGVNGQSADTFNLDYIDEAVEAATTGDNQMQPVMIDGMACFLLYIHPWQATALRKNAGATQWKDIQMAFAAGGKIKDNPLVNGSLGMYNRCIIRECQDVTFGVHSTSGAVQANVRRAVLLGRCAATMAYGQMGGAGKFRWNEELKDHKRKLEVSAWTHWGLKKAQFDSKDYGVCVISTYAAAAA